jgi:replicative DNA helicase
LNNQLNIKEIISNPGAERVVLANCINNPNLIIECEAQGLYPKHFAVEANNIIYNAIVFLFSNNAKIDAISILNVIKDEKAKQVIENIGGIEYLMLLQQSPTTSNLAMFCQEIIACSVRRSLYDTFDELQNYLLETNATDTDQIFSTANQKLTELSLNSQKKLDVYKMGDSLENRLDDITNNVTDVPGLPSGWPKLDRITKGGQPGDLVIVCAESKTGKSVTLLNWAKSIAIDHSLPILWIDSEQTQAEQENRLVSNISQIPEDEIVTGLYTQDTANGTAKEKIARMKCAIDILKQSQFYHVYMPDFTLEKIQALTRQFHLKHGIVALFFDYINLNPTLLSQNKHLRDDIILTNLAIGLKDIAGILQIPVYTANQENRSGYGSTEKDARNIGGSIGVLQKATKLFFLRNKTEAELAMDGASRGNQKLLIKYQRHGESGDVELDIMYNKPVLTQYEV